MISGNALKIVNFLLRNIQEYNINRIARELGISVGSAYKILKILEGKKLIEPKKLGNAMYYKLNLDNRETQKMSEIVLIESKSQNLDSNPRASICAGDLKKQI